MIIIIDVLFGINVAFTGNSVLELPVILPIRLSLQIVETSSSHLNYEQKGLKVIILFVVV